MEEYKVARAFRDSRIGTIGGGTSEIMREIISKMVIDDVAYESASIPNQPQQNVKTISENGNPQTDEQVDFEKIFSGIQAKAANANPLGKTLKFNIGEDHLFIDGTGKTNDVSKSDSDADCTVNISLIDFSALVSGKLDPMGAVMSGKVKIDGDMGVAMKLQGLFG